MKSEWRFPSTDGTVGSILSPLIAGLQSPKTLIDWTALNALLPGSLPDGMLNLAPLYDIT
jgi:hypothetical protein